jgi:hypothetical protein
MLPLSEVVRSNINQFDVELYYRDPDIREKRLSFRSGDGRERRIMENILAITGGRPAYARIAEIIASNPEVLHVAPSYAEVEITGRCELDCIFCFRKKTRIRAHRYAAAEFERLIDGLSSFGLPYSLCFGGSGEPLMHASFYEFTSRALRDGRLKNLVVETNGLLAGDNLSAFVRSTGDPRLRFIVNINAIDGPTYAALHGQDRFERVQRTSCGPGSRLTGRPLRADTQDQRTEPFLDRYYDAWEKSRRPHHTSETEYLPRPYRGPSATAISPRSSAFPAGTCSELLTSFRRPRGLLQQDVNAPRPGVSLATRRSGRSGRPLFNPSCATTGASVRFVPTAAPATNGTPLTFRTAYGSTRNGCKRSR